MSSETPAPSKAAKVLVGADDLKAMVTDVFQARGARAADAAAVADALVWANLRGVDSHGVSRVARYLELFDKGESVADAEVTVTRPRAAIAIVDAHAAPGPVAMNRAADEASHWPLGDPIARLQAHMVAIGVWSAERQEQLAGEVDAEVREAQREAESHGTLGSGEHHSPATMFDDVFKEMPWHLRRQRREAGF